MLQRVLTFPPSFPLEEEAACLSGPRNFRPRIEPTRRTSGWPSSREAACPPAAGTGSVPWRRKAPKGSEARTGSSLTKGSGSKPEISFAIFFYVQQQKSFNGIEPR